MEPIVVRGVPGSPYTRKMIALLRYRRLPYRWWYAGNGAHGDLPKPKVELLPTLYLRGDDGELEAVVDSTPIVRRLESLAMGRSVIPGDAALAFVDELLEDYADEWVTKAMFHYRWRYAADIERAGDVLPRWGAIDAPEARARERKAFIARRQIDRLYVVGSNDVTAPVIESSYVRLLDLLAARFEAAPFLFGARPASADFALYGQLTQLTHFDPTPMAIALERAPRVYAWVDVVDDLSGLDTGDDAWPTLRDLTPALRPLLQEVGRTYVPVMLANARAISRGEQQVNGTVDGAPWQQQPFPYQARCVAWLRQSYARLDDDVRADVDAALAGTGCEPMFARA